MSSLDRLKGIAPFVASVEHGSFTAAAEHLHLTSSADGRTVARTVSHRMTPGDGEAQVAAVIAGPGVAQMASWLMEKPLTSGELVPILPELAVESLPLYIVWPRKKQLTPKVNALLAALDRLKI